MVYSTDALPYEPIDFKNRIDRFILTFSPKEDTENGNIDVNQYVPKTIKIDPTEKYIAGFIYSINIPEKWKKEGISAPTLTCKEMAEKISRSIYNDFGLIPSRISATIEEGIFYLDKQFCCIIRNLKKKEII